MMAFNSGQDRFGNRPDRANYRWNDMRSWLMTTVLLPIPADLPDRR
jgi:hypothetical protein